jgi:hypothetical protein
MKGIVKEYRELISSDVGLKTKRRNLIVFSSILIALNYSGAVIKEANTFLFKIEFTDKTGINEIFVMVTMYLLLRYYTYAQQYHKKLMQLWIGDMLSDPKILRCTPAMEDATGLLADCLPYLGDEPQIGSAKYLVSGFYHRSLSYPKWYGEQEAGDGRFFDELISCTKWTNTWSFSKYLKLLAYEAKYQIIAYFTTREQLDLVAPYFIGLFAIALTLKKMIF